MAPGTRSSTRFPGDDCEPQYRLGYRKGRRGRRQSGCGKHAADGGADPGYPAMTPAPQSTQTEVADYFVADTGYHLCKGCKNVRQGAWAFTGLCLHCCALPSGGLRTRYDNSVVPLDLMPEDRVP